MRHQKQPRKNTRHRGRKALLSPEDIARFLDAMPVRKQQELLTTIKEVLAKKQEK